MINKIKVVAYMVLVVVIIIMSILIMGLIKDKSDSVIQQKAQEIVDQIDSSSADTTDSMVIAEKHESLRADSISENRENLVQPADSSIAEFYEKRDRGKGYADERQKLLIENSIFNYAELEKNKYALSEQIEGFIKEIYSEHGDPVSVVYAQRNGYDTAVVMMEDGFELQLRVITVRTGVFDFEEVH